MTSVVPVTSGDFLPHFSPPPSTSAWLKFHSLGISINVRSQAPLGALTGSLSTPAVGKQLVT